jgi:Uma2 family endonuclease
MAIDTRISNEAYERLALVEPDRKWELWDGQLREKPGMTHAHNRVSIRLGHLLMLQLDMSEYEVRVDAGRVHRPGATYVIPDVYVFPVSYVTPSLRAGDALEVYERPLPLVVEVWSRSTGAYDVRRSSPSTSSAATARSGSFPLPPPSPDPGEGSVPTSGR